MGCVLFLFFFISSGLDGSCRCPSCRPTSEWRTHSTILRIGKLEGNLLDKGEASWWGLPCLKGLREEPLRKAHRGVQGSWNWGWSIFWSLLFAWTHHFLPTSLPGYGILCFHVWEGAGNDPGNKRLHWYSTSIGSCRKPSSLRFQLQKIVLTFHRLQFNICSCQVYFIWPGRSKGRNTSLLSCSAWWNGI